jgi:uncharacterized protein (TIRG00374 family)
LKNYIKYILLFLFAAIILWFFGKDLDWQQVRQSFARANITYLLVAVAIICLGYLLRAIRWKVLLEPITKTSLKELFATTTVGFAAIFLVGRAGEIVRPMWLPMRDPRVRPSAALVTLGLERIFDLAALVSFFSVNLLWFTPPAGRASEFIFIENAGYLMLAGVVVGFVMLAVFQRKSPRVIAWVERVTDRKFIPIRIRKIVSSLFKQLASALSIMRDWRELLIVSLWSVALWFSISIPTWLVLLAFDLPLTFSDSLFIMGFAVVSSVVPTPGGAAGAFHAGTAFPMILLGVAIEDAAAVSIAMHLVYFAPALIFGLYYFLHGDISIERFRSLLSSEHAVEEIVSESPDRQSNVQSPKPQVGTETAN